MSPERKIYHRNYYMCLTILVLALWSSQGFAATEISNVRHWGAPDHTRIVFDLNDEPDYQLNIRENILILEFHNAVFKKSLPAELIIGRPGISKIIFTSADDNKCKVEIDSR